MGRASGSSRQDVYPLGLLPGSSRQKDVCPLGLPLAAELTDPVAAAAGPLADSRARFLGVHSTD